MTKKNKIIRLSKKGLSPSKILEKVDTTRNYIDSVRSKNKDKWKEEPEDTRKKPEREPKKPEFEPIELKSKKKKKAKKVKFNFEPLDPSSQKQKMVIINNVKGINTYPQARALIKAWIAEKGFTKIDTEKTEVR